MRRYLGNSYSSQWQLSTSAGEALRNIGLYLCCLKRTANAFGLDKAFSSFFLDAFLVIKINFYSPASQINLLASFVLCATKHHERG